MSGLQFLQIRRFHESDEIYAAWTTIIARQTTINLKIRPNVRSMYKLVNIRSEARFAVWLTRLFVPLQNMAAKC